MSRACGELVAVLTLALGTLPDSFPHDLTSDSVTQALLFFFMSSVASLLQFLARHEEQPGSGLSSGPHGHPRKRRKGCGDWNVKYERQGSSCSVHLSVARKAATHVVTVPQGAAHSNWLRTYLPKE